MTFLLGMTSLLAPASQVPPGWPSGSFQEWRSLIFEPRADQEIFFGKFPDLEVFSTKNLWGHQNGMEADVHITALII